MRRSAGATATGYDSAKALSMRDVAFGLALALGIGGSFEEDRTREESAQMVILLLVIVVVLLFLVLGSMGD